METQAAQHCVTSTRQLTKNTRHRGCLDKVTLQESPELLLLRDRHHDGNHLIMGAQKCTAGMPPWAMHDPGLARTGQRG
jgi:hypothetical protein